MSEQTGEWSTELTIDFLFEKACRLDDDIKAREAELIAPLVQQKEAIEETIRAKCLEQGASISTNYGIVKYRQAGSRTSWDDTALLGIVADLSAAGGNDQLVARLMSCRQVTTTKEGTSISYRGITV